MNLRIAFVLVLCSLAFAASAQTHIGLHLNSVHSPSKDHHQNQNRGLYVRGESYQTGFYVNSVNRLAPYAAYVHKLGPVDLLVGVAGAYQKKCTTEVTRTEKKVVFEKRENGDTSTTTYPVIETRKENCMGFSRGYLTPMAGLSIASPVSFLGATPVLTFSPGFGKASAVAHLAIQWSIK